MRPANPLKPTRVAACVCAALALSLLGPATAGAAAGQNLFGSPEPPPAATKPAARAGKAAPGAAKAKVAPAVKVKTTAAPAAAPPASTPTTATTATAETSSKTSTPMIMAVVALFLVLGGIAYYILRDARSVAPVVEGAATGGTRNPEGRLRKRRAQAKAARMQRKRHRKR
jgi:hypothetical protein